MSTIRDWTPPALAGMCAMSLVMNQAMNIRAFQVSTELAGAALKIAANRPRENLPKSKGSNRMCLFDRLGGSPNLTCHRALM
jgi:hypothetical protein